MGKLYAHGGSNPNRRNRNPIFYPLNYGRVVDWWCKIRKNFWGEQIWVGAEKSAVICMSKPPPLFRDNLFLLDFPAECTCAKHSCIAFLKFGNEDFSLALVDVEHVAVVSFLDRLHDEVASLGETAEEDVSLWA